MFKDDIFDQWLDEEAHRVLGKLKSDDTKLTIEDKMILTLKAQTNHFYHLDIELCGKIDDFQKDQNKKWDDQNKKWDDQNKKWDEQNKKWDENQKELQNLRIEANKTFDAINKIYYAMNNQTWKMIGAVGFIVVLGKLIETFGK